MRTINFIKKVFALGTGFVLLAGSVLGASYPGSFLKDGVTDFSLVVGDNAAPSDITGSIDIAIDLQHSFDKIPPKSTKTAAEKELEIRELMGVEVNTLSSSDLLGLRSGTISTGERSTKYNQYIRTLDDVNSSAPDHIHSGYVTFIENNNDEARDYLYFRTGDIVFEYEIEFEEGFVSDVQCITGSSCTSGVVRKLEDLEDEQITMLGQEMTIVNARALTSSNELTLKLVAGDILDTLEEGQVKKYDLDGNIYEVKVLIISDASNSNNADSVSFIINGETTDQLTEGETDILSDGVLIGIRSILPNEAGEIHGADLVEFFLGANIIELKDNDYTDDSFSVSTVTVNSEDIEDSDVRIKAAETENDLIEISSIVYRLRADGPQGDIYIPAGETLGMHLKEVEGMLHPGWDIRYDGLTEPSLNTLKFDANGDNSYEIDFINRAKESYSIPYLDNSRRTENAWKFGDDDGDLVFREGVINISTPNNHVFPIDEGDFVLLKTASNSVSKVLRYDSIDTSNKRITFTDLGKGSREVIYQDSPITGVLGTANLIAADERFLLYVGNISAPSATKGFITSNQVYPLAIDQNNDKDVKHDEINLRHFKNAALTLGNQSWISENGAINCTASSADGKGTYCAIDSATDTKRSMNLTLSTSTTKFEDNGVLDSEQAEDLTIQVFSKPNDEVDISVPTPQVISDSASGWASLQNGGTAPITILKMIGLDNKEKKQGISTYGAFLDIGTEKDRANDLKIEYPNPQKKGKVTFLMGEQIKSLDKLPPGIAKLSSEVKNVQNENLILVGGPCINPTTAELLGNPKPCYDGFYPGRAMIRFFEHGEKVSMIVAGYSGEDTEKAAVYASKQDDLKESLVLDTSGVEAVPLNE
jgi:hypothetical protein